MPIYRPDAVFMPGQPIRRGGRRRGMGAAAATASSAQIQQMIANAAQQYGVPSNIALEVAIQESALNPNAVSSAGAQGVFQLEPATAAQLGVTDSFDPQQNINGGVQYLAQLYSKFGSWDLALGAYNWGPGNVSKAVASQGGDWLSSAPAETQNYVSSILGAVGGNYSATVTPSSVANGVVQSAGGILSNLEDSVSNVAAGQFDSASLLYLTGGLLVAYIAYDFVQDLLD